MAGKKTSEEVKIGCEQETGVGVDLEKDARQKKLVMNGISKKYDDTKVLRDISLQVCEGEHVTVLGPSGCGKSTLMNILTGILEADQGEVTVNGKIGYMQQKDLLLPWKTCMENVILPDLLAGMQKESAISRAKPYFKTFGLEGFENAGPAEMSGGMRQRASLMRTFLSSGDIFLLDEPFGAVDSITRGNLQQWLIDVTKELGLTILMITHDIEEAILLSDRIYVLSEKPASVKDEIVVDFSEEQKKERLFHPDFLEMKKRILEDLM